MGLALIGFIEFICIVGLAIGLIGLLLSFLKKKRKRTPLIISGVSLCTMCVMITISVIFFHGEMERQRIARQSKKAEDDTITTITYFNKIAEQTTKSNNTNRQEPLDEIETTMDAVAENINEETTENEAVSEVQQDKTDFDEKYFLNNFLYEYNDISEYKIDNETLNNIRNNKRPLGRLTYIFENGVYIIATYNENYNIFIDLQYEGKSDEQIFPIFKGIIQALRLPSIDEESINSAWQDLQTGEYANYNNYNLSGINCSYAYQNILDGNKRYYIKIWMQFE